MVCSASDEEIKNFYSTLSKDIREANNGVQTRIANAFFLNKNYTIEEQYADTISKEYSAKVDSLDFDQIEETAKTINDFVGNATVGKIKNLITEEMVKGKAILNKAFSLVVNAIYFTAKWEFEFSKELTAKAMFHSSENQEKEVRTLLFFVTH
ncbi:unnamed protein product [Strongylus vulgaris]|uniref:Serpin domain-containing protein n=1 Tax=Strongylus vulgaris TaxID=40348 RepID=A0A3P7KSX9_STRVU|nr:unnamed protein product [Strongylus vulgaris]